MNEQQKELVHLYKGVVKLKINLCKKKTWTPPNPVSWKGWKRGSGFVQSFNLVDQVPAPLPHPLGHKAAHHTASTVLFLQILHWVHKLDYFACFTIITRSTIYILSSPFLNVSHLPCHQNYIKYWGSIKPRQVQDSSHNPLSTQVFPIWNSM